MRSMRSGRFVGIGVLASVCLLGILALVVVGQSKVTPEAIASSVTRTPELVERA